VRQAKLPSVSPPPTLWRKGLSTLESIVLAMHQLEPWRDFPVMLRPFKHMIALQMDVSGASKTNGDKVRYHGRLLIYTRHL
jgi:hypothetical protein